LSGVEREREKNLHQRQAGSSVVGRREKIKIKRERRDRSFGLDTAATATTGEGE
jgi:hypothetical protein